MKLVFSPFYDGETYIDYSRGSVTDRCIMGPAGLLSELELRAGLTSIQLSDMERQAMYLLSLRKYMAHTPKSIFAASVKVDDFGVAAELLRWRDELVKVGWHKDLKGISDKLDALAEIESDFDCAGTADRWHKVIEHSARHAMLPAGWEVEVHMRKDMLLPAYATILDNLEKNGTKVEYVTATPCAHGNLREIQRGLVDQSSAVAIDPADKTSLRILKFRRLNDAYEWVAQQNFEPCDTVIVNQDSKQFNNVLYSHGKPRCGSKISNGNPQVVQLFKLGLSLFIKPLNVYNLLSYLQVGLNPLPRSLRNKLTEHIVGTGGLGDGWRKILDEHRFSDDENENRKKKKQKYIFIEMAAETDSSGCIEVLKLRKYISELAAWSTGQLNAEMTTDVGIREQLANINTFCDTFRILLDSVTDKTITCEQLKSWIMSIYRPADYVHESAQRLSPSAVNTPASIADNPKKAIWLDCFDKSPQTYPFDFLNRTEKELLQSNGITIWGKGLQTKAVLWAIKNGLQKATESVDIIIADENNGNELSLHPIIIELEQRLGKERFNSLVMCESELEMATEQMPTKPLPTPKIEYNLPNLKIVPREQESYSSLEKLVLYPFDYTLKYFAKLPDKGIRQLQEQDRTCGNVAHKMIKVLVEESGNNVRRFAELASEQFDLRFQQAVEQTGLILLLPENKLEMERFRIKLKHAIASLSYIMESNGLNIVGCEIEECAEFENMPPIVARMDLVLTNNIGEYIVFDMKWSESNYRYRSKLQGNGSMQLEIYKAVLKNKYPNKNVAATGYFLLKRGMLVTSDSFPNEWQIEIVDKKSDFDLFTQVRNSYRYRYSQLTEGVVEEASGMNLTDIEYYNDTAAKGLYPLEAEYGDKNRKASNGYSAYTTLKGHLK